MKEKTIIDEDLRFWKELELECGHTLMIENSMLQDFEAAFGQEMASLVKQMQALEIERHESKQCSPVDFTLELHMKIIKKRGIK